MMQSRAPGQSHKKMPSISNLALYLSRSPATCSCNCRTDGVQRMQSLIDTMISLVACMLAQAHKETSMGIDVR